jgi:hypothetical protein
VPNRQAGGKACRTLMVVTTQARERERNSGRFADTAGDAEGRSRLSRSINHVSRHPQARHVARRAAIENSIKGLRRSLSIRD